MDQDKISQLSGHVGMMDLMASLVYRTIKQLLIQDSQQN